MLSSCVIIGRSNTLMCYKYEVDRDGEQRPIINRPIVLNLRSVIEKIHICDSKFLSDRGEIAFVVQAKNELTLYYCDLKENRLI